MLETIIGHWSDQPIRIPSSPFSTNRGKRDTSGACRWAGLDAEYLSTSTIAPQSIINFHRAILIFSPYALSLSSCIQDFNNSSHKLFDVTFIPSRVFVFFFFFLLHIVQDLRLKSFPDLKRVDDDDDDDNDDDDDENKPKEPKFN